MKIWTNRGQTFDVEWIWGPLLGTDQLMLEMEDSRSIEEIAQDFDGLETISRKSESEGDAVYTGYNTLVSVIRDTAKGTARLTLERSDAA